MSNALNKEQQCRPGQARNNKKNNSVEQIITKGATTSNKE